MVELAQKMRAAEAARYLRMAGSTLAKLRGGGGGLRFAKVGRRLVVYDRADLDAWLVDRVCRSTSEYASLAKRAR
jgi:hypothetical protein